MDSEHLFFSHILSFAGNLREGGSDFDDFLSYVETLGNKYLEAGSTCRQFLESFSIHYDVIAMQFFRHNQIITPDDRKNAQKVEPFFI